MSHLVLNQAETSGIARRNSESLAVLAVAYAPGYAYRAMVL